MVTKTSFRLLQTLINLGPSPEPNITIFWDPELPAGYKEFCAHISIETSSIQYESDRQIRDEWGDDAAIACCVSPMEVGKQMQFFGARVNAAKALLYAMNGGRDEVSGKQIVEGYEPIQGDGPLDFDEVWQKYEEMLDWVVGTYVEALNIIHYSHDKYAYEAVEMALHDSNIIRSMGCGIAGLSIVADSLSAIKYAKVTPVRDETGLITDYITEGEFPFYGNDDDRADDIAATIVHTVMEKIKAIPMYRNAIPTQSVLTIPLPGWHARAKEGIPAMPMAIMAVVVDGPHTAPAMMASSKAGKASSRSEPRMMRESRMLLRRMPATTPSGTPTSAAMPTAMTPTKSVMRAPTIRREAMSRPKRSVPRRCSAELPASKSGEAMFGA